MSRPDCWAVWKPAQPGLHCHTARQYTFEKGQPVESGRMAVGQLDMLREMFQEQGRMMIPRHNDDHPDIVEVWL